MGNYSFHLRELTFGLIIFFLTFQGKGQGILNPDIGKGNSLNSNNKDLFFGPFGAGLSLWEAGPESNGSIWEWGNPNYGMTSTAHTPPTAWDVNLNTAYTNLAHCVLVSPSFNFTGIYHAQLSLWINYKTQASYDGFWLEYSIDNGSSWTNLGIYNDPNGINWYTCTNLSGTSNPAWEGNSNGWQQVHYDLSFLDNQSNPVKFRFVFHANATITEDGVSIDDFSIVIPATREASLRIIVAPNSGCGLDQEIVTVVILNAGLYNINGGLTASYKVNDSGTIVTEAVNSVIPSGGSFVYYFTTPIDLHTNLVDKYFMLKVWVNLVNDPNQTDDTAVNQITSRARPDPPILSKHTPVYYGSSVSLTAISPFTITWFNFPSGGIPLSTGFVYSTFPLYGNSIIYAECTAPNGCVSQRAGDTMMVIDAPVYPLPFADNFDLFNYFRPYPGQGTNWIRGGISNGIYPDTIPSQPFIWGTNLNLPSGYHDKARCALLSPAFDFSDAVHAVLSFKLKYRSQTCHDGAFMECSTDGGLSWALLGSTNDTKGNNWYNSLITDQQAAWSGVSAGWQNASYVLSQFDHFQGRVMFRLVFYSDNLTNDKGFFVDNFSIILPLPQDPGISRMIQPLGLNTYCDLLSVKVVLQNYGSDTLTQIPVKYNINGLTSGSLTWTGILLPDSAVLISFPAVPSPLQDYTLCVYTDLYSDFNYSNDSLSKMVVVEAPWYDVSVEQIIEPGNVTIHGAYNTVSLSIRNKGKLPLSNIPVGYSISGTSVSVNEMWTGPSLLQGESTVYTFNQPYQFEYYGFYVLCDYTLLPDDCYVNNDSSCRKIEAIYTTTNIPGNLPNELSLSQNYPNPADQNTQIIYSIPSAGPVYFTMINYLGQELMSLKETVSAGEHPIHLATSDFPEGLYYYNLAFGGQHLSRKLVLNHAK